LAIHGVKLTVDVGDTDFIEINHGDVADSRTGEGFDNPRAHSANADYCDMGLVKSLKSASAVESGNSGKTHGKC
jgi:hypothetical protein